MIHNPADELLFPANARFASVVKAICSMVQKVQSANVGIWRRLDWPSHLSLQGLQFCRYHNVSSRSGK